MENYDMNSSFLVFQKNQQELASILRDASSVTQTLGMSKEKSLADLSAKVQNDTFKIMVTGTFKNGKSTFINALLGEEILPAYAVPTTAIINEVKYGAKKEAILYFRDPLPEILPQNLAPAAVCHMQQYKGKKIPPMKIPYTEIEDYVVIPMGADEKQTKLQSPYEKVELFYPLDLLKNGVEIIDSPGLNEDETRTKVTMEYLSKVDAILYVLNANAICAGDEMKFVEKDLKGNAMDSVFFVVNRFDQIRLKEQPQVRQYAAMKLKEYYQDNLELFCISALKALDGRLDGDAQAIEESGILPLEKRLAEFLTKEKGKAKLAGPAKQVRQILAREALTVVLPRENKLLDASLEEVQNRYNELKPKLDTLSKTKEQKAQELDIKIERVGRKLERVAKRRINDIINDIPAWVEEYQPINSVGVVPTKGKIEKVASEIIEHIKSKIADEQHDWQRDVFTPEVEDEAKSIFEAAEHDFSKIFEQIDEINVDIVGGDYDGNPVPFWQRVAGVAGGLLMGDITLAFSGGVNGIGKEFAKTAAFEVGAGFVLSLFGLLNPITLIAIVVMAVLVNVGRSSDRSIEKIKEQIAQQVAETLANDADKQASKMVGGIEEKLYGVKQQIVDSISHELNDLEKQMESALEDKKKGESRVASRRVELKECERKINALNERLDALIFALVE